MPLARAILATAAALLLSSVAADAQEWKTEGKYQIKQMESEYSDSRNEVRYDPANNVLYLDDQTRQRFKLQFRTDPKGRRLAYLPNGELLNTGTQKAIFVMDAEGNFYAITREMPGIPWPQQGPAHLRHSTIPAGEPVAAAGHMQVMAGNIVYLDNNSGHYKPENVHLVQAIDALNAHGVAKGSYEVDFERWDPVKASYLALDPQGQRKLQKGEIALLPDEPGDQPDAREPRDKGPDRQPVAVDDARLLKPDEPVSIPELDVSRRARQQAPAPTTPEIAKPVAPPQPDVAQTIKDRITQTPADQMDVRFMQEIYQLDPKAAKLVGQLMADPNLRAKNLKMGELRKTMDLEVWKDILKRRSIRVEITNQGKSNGIRSDLDYTLYYVAEEAGVSIEDLIEEHTKAWRTLHQLSPDRVEIKVMNGDEFYPDWRTEGLGEAEYRAEVKRILGRLRGDPEKYSVPGANKQQVHNRALREGWTEVLQYDPVLDKPELPLAQQIIKTEGRTREVALRYKGVHPQYNYMNALGNLIQNQGEFLHHSGDNAQDAIRRAKYFNRVINEGLGNLRFFANDYQQLYASDLPDRDARKLEYLKRTFGVLTDDNGRPRFDEAMLRRFRAIIDISMEIEIDKVRSAADYNEKRAAYLSKDDGLDYRARAEATVAEQTRGQEIPPHERVRRILAEQERLFEADRKRVLAEALLAGLRHSVARDLTPEGALRNRVRFDPATQKFVIDDPTAPKLIAFERATEVALFYELVNSLDDLDPEQKRVGRDLRKRVLSAAPSDELADFYWSLDEVGKAEIDRFVAGDPDSRVQRGIDDLLRKQQARALELLIARKERAVERARAKGIVVDPRTIPPTQVRDHIVAARLDRLDPSQRAQFRAAYQALGTQLAGDLREAFYANASALMMGASAVNLISAWQTCGEQVLRCRALHHVAFSEAINYLPGYIQTPFAIADMLFKVKRGEYLGAAWQGGLVVAMVRSPTVGSILLGYNIASGVPSIVYTHFVTRIDADLVEQALRSRPRNESGGPLPDGVRARANRIPDATRSVYRGSGPGFPLFYGRYRNPHAIRPIVVDGEKYSDGRVPHDELSDDQLADSAAVAFAPLIDSMLTAARLEPGSPEWRKRAWDLKLKFGFDIPFYRRMAKVYEEKYKYITYYDNYPENRYNPEYLSECRRDVYEWYLQQPDGYKLELKGDLPLRDQTDKMQEIIAQGCARILGNMREAAERANEINGANLKGFNAAMARGFEAERTLLAAKVALTRRIQADEEKAARELDQKALALAEKHKTHLAVSYPFTFATEELPPELEFDLRTLPVHVKQPVAIEIDQVITGVREGAPSGWRPGPGYEDRFKPDAEGWVAYRPITAEFQFTAQLLDSGKKPVAESTLDLPVVLYEPSFSGSITVTVYGATAAGDSAVYGGALVTLGSETLVTDERTGSTGFQRLKAGSHAVKVDPREGDDRHGPGSGSATLTDALLSKDLKGDSHGSITVLLPYIPEPIAATKPPTTKARSDPEPDTTASEPGDENDLVTVPDVTGIADPDQRVRTLERNGLKATHNAAGHAPSKDLEFRVAGQDPRAGTKVRRGTVVTIALYQQVIDEVTVPDLSLFRDGSEMQAALQHLGLKPAFGTPVPAPSPDLEGRFAGQSPRPGTKVKLGTTVTIIGYAVSDLVTVPDLSLFADGAEMQAVLHHLGLKPTFGTPVPAPSPELEGRFAAQVPWPGTRVRRGTVVTITGYGKVAAAVGGNVSLRLLDAVPHGAAPWAIDGRGGFITHQDPSAGFLNTYRWTPAPGDLSPQGTTMTMTVTTQPPPGHSMALGMSAGSDHGFEFKFYPDPHTVSGQPPLYLVTQNGQPGSKSLKVDVKPPRGLRPGSEVSFWVGAAWGAWVEYRYRVER